MLDRPNYQDCQTGNVVPFPGPDEVDQADDMGQLVQIICTAAQSIFDNVKQGNPARSKNLDRIAHKKEVDWLSHALAQIQFAASSADVRRIANEQIAQEDASA